MVAYSFTKRFRDPIQRGVKTQTVRMPRKRHARVGEPIQLYTGMQTKYCRKVIDDPICTAVHSIAVYFDKGRVPEIERITVGGVSVRDLDAFARRDGFKHAADMAAFWRTQQDVSQGFAFLGVVIEWAPGDPLELAFASGGYTRGPVAAAPLVGAAQ
ncbi:MAG: hypothetical protein AAGP08_00170 [Pseudomonadota bacterium]